MCDKEIMVLSGLLQLLDQADTVIADREFDIDDELCAMAVR